MPSVINPFPHKLVALLTEGVDRNIDEYLWTTLSIVALLTEGVDRNRAYAMIWNEWFRSPSSRRAWIEIRPVLPVSSAG